MSSGGGCRNSIVSFLKRQRPDIGPFHYEHEKAIMRCRLETCPKGRCWPWPFSPWRIFPDPPSLIGIEEPERGVHPRLLRNIQTALYRLSYPKQFGEDRQPVQVIATTHSPYFLDLYKDHPEEIVIAQKTADGAQFERLSDQPDIMEVLDDAPLGEVWYSGVLGGVPAEQ